LVLVSIRGWVEPRAIMAPERLGKLKISSDIHWNRIRDLPASAQCLSQLRSHAHLDFCVCEAKLGLQPPNFSTPTNWILHTDSALTTTKTNKKCPDDEHRDSFRNVCVLFNRRGWP
jgi:hypothetical protein